MNRLGLLGVFALALGVTSFGAACGDDPPSSADYSDGGAPPPADSSAPPARDASVDAAGTKAVRVSSETRGETVGVDRTLGVEMAQRCPEGALVVGIDVVVANDVTLRCAVVGPDGSLGAETSVASGATFSGEPTTLRCPTGEVAVRLTGSHDGSDFKGVGLLCTKPLDVTDGGRIGAGNASAPAVFGAAQPGAFDAPCPDGAALSGLASFAYSEFGTPNPAGFGAVTPLCRRVLRDKSPSGLVLDASHPFVLGPAVTSPPVKLVSSADTPTTPPTSTLDCPDGSVVTGLDGGSSPRSGPAVIAELQLTCRALAPDATLGVESAAGRGVTGALVARCLEGHGVRSVELDTLTLDAGPVTITTPRYGFPTCALPDAIDTPSPELALPAAFPQSVDPEEVEPSLSFGCPKGALLTGVDQWITPDDDGRPSSLHHVAARCRPVTR